MKVAAHACAVVEHRWVNARYKYLRLAAPAPLAAATVAGQFFQLACPVSEAARPFLRRPMSVYGIGPEPERLEFLYHVKGLGTRALERLAPGGSLTVIGPLGRGFSFSPGWKRVLLVARGVGLATMAPVVPLAARAGVAVTALLSARSPGDLMAQEFLRGAPAQVHAVFDSDGSSALEQQMACAMGVCLSCVRLFDEDG
ncbi:MAG TPA: dihydroorotate dehydrogenase electron transfer subunit, partial [Burkholderiales bacterium]|nr:dihydroorotate dehydrogenase electron transfer subunit [Burkholderiales bacterium]